MTLNEALLELRVALPCTVEEVRRGYLRRLKGCKPERDPAGFRRLRESYELVLGLAGEGGFPEPAGAGFAAEQVQATKAERAVGGAPEAEPADGGEPAAW